MQVAYVDECTYNLDAYIAYQTYISKIEKKIRLKKKKQLQNSQLNFLLVSMEPIVQKRLQSDYLLMMVTMLVLMLYEDMDIQNVYNYYRIDTLDE